MASERHAHTSIHTDIHSLACGYAFLHTHRFWQTWVWSLEFRVDLARQYSLWSQLIGNASKLRPCNTELVFMVVCTRVFCLWWACICLCHQSQPEPVWDESLLIIKETSENRDQNRMHSDTFGSEKAETVWVVIAAALWCVLTSLGVNEKLVGEPTHTDYNTWTSFGLPADYF